MCIALPRDQSGWRLAALARRLRLLRRLGGGAATVRLTHPARASGCVVLGGAAVAVDIGAACLGSAL